MVALVLMAAGPLAGQASASHFRHGNLNWTETAGAPAGSQRITVQYEQSWRWDAFGSPAQGSVISNGEGCIDWGDGSVATCPEYLVEFVNAAENYMRVQALAPGSRTDINVPHDYANPSGTFTIRTSGCCTISTLQNANDSSWNILGTVNLAGDDESAVSTIPAIVTLAPGGVRQFTVPASDAGGETLSFRLSDPTESCVDCVAPHPPDLSINSSTGQVTFDTTNKSGLYWTGVVIESRNAAGAVVATSHIQYIINVGAGGSLNQAPVWGSPPTPADGTVFTVNPGDTVSFTLQASDPDAGNTVSILQNSGPGTLTPINGNPATAMYSFTPTSADAGKDFIVQFIAQDQEGAGPPFRSYTIKVNAADTTPPETTITSGPSGTTTDRNPSFGFTSSEPTGATFQCKLDGPGAATGSFGDCTPSPKAYANLADGSYTFSVKAKDAAGNEDQTPATRTFTVDTTPPETTITSGPSGATTNRSPSFGFTSSEPTGATFQCKLDGPGTTTGSFGDCTPSPKAYANLADGSYTFSVRARDAAGNEDATPATRSFAVDTAAPETVITSGPSGSSTQPEFSFGSSEPGSTFECRVDAGAFAPCSSPHTTDVLAPGEHTFEVRATDALGNVDETPASRTFTVASPPGPPPGAPDRTPPQTTITVGPQGAIDDNTPTFEFSSDEPGSTFECSIDGGPFFPCSSPFTTPPLSFGTHTFEVRAIDSAGNVDPSPATAGDASAARRRFTVLAGTPGPPILGRTLNATPVRGEVFVSLPVATARASASVPGLKGRRFIPLREARQVPIGSLFDTQRGTVRLTSARNTSGATQSADFVAGVFQVLQSRARSARGLTELRLRGASFRACATGRRGKRSSTLAQIARSRTIRRLRGNGSGRFRTRGRYSAATVRGTDWTVTDRCDGTLTKVRRGTVAVRDFRRRKTVTVRAGKSYLARTRR